jgi:hypothetical protein
MKYFVFIFFGIITSFQLLAIDPVGKIAKANAAKERAEEALRNGDFEKVVEHYTYLLDSLGYESPEAELNRAHAYFQLKDTVNAFDAYRRVSDVNNDQLKSKAMLQMGNLSEMQKEYESALSFFKEALKADPTNNKARYNYELLKKKMKEQEKQNQDQDQNQDQNQDNKDQQEQDQENKDQQNKENKDSENQQKDENQEKSQEDKESEEQQQKDDAEQQDGEQSEQDKGKEQKEQKQQEQKEGEEKKEGEEQEMKPSTKQKLEEMNISEEKAQMILEALKNKESQYFQQLRKKATKKQDSGKPDW